MADFAPVTQYVKKPKFPTVADLYPPNNSKAFLENMADAELTSRETKYRATYKSKQRATGGKRKPATVLD